MNVLKTVTTEQDIFFVPRQIVQLVDVYLTDENTKIVTSFSPTLINQNGWMAFSHSYSLIEGRFYKMEVFNQNPDDGDGLIYRDRIFCTDQTELNKYNPASGEYVQPNNTDPIIII